MRRELLSHKDSRSHEHLPCSRRMGDDDGIHTPCSVAHTPDSHCKGEHRNGHGNLDETFPAATGRPPGPLDVTLICTSKVEKGSKVVSGHRGPSPRPIGGPGPQAIGRSQLSGGGSIN